MRASPLRRSRSGSGEIPHADYFLQLMSVTHGTLDFYLDFEKITLEAGQALFILPFQVHWCTVPVGLEGHFLGIERAFVPASTYGAIRAIGPRPLDVGPKRAKSDSLERIIKTLEDLSADPDSSTNLLCCLGRAAVELASQMASRVATSDTKVAGMRDVAIDFVNLAAERYAETKSPAEYAGILGISPAYLSKCVRASTGWSPVEILRHEVVAQAKRVLYFSDSPVREVASMLGYGDPAYFCRIFSREAGCSPSDFRRRFRRV